MAELVTRDLNAYLRAAARQPFVWGSADCALFVADWVQGAAGAADPAEAWRGRYASEAQALKLAGFLGFPGLIAKGARGAGLARTRAVEPGDIGIVVIGKAVGAINTGRGWAARLPRGLVVMIEPRVLAAWSVPCPKP